MILDDEAPVLFVIPRKIDVSKSKKTVQAKTTKESLPAKPPLQTEAEGTTSKRSKAQTESGKKQAKRNRSKASKKNGKDADVLEKRINSVPEVLQEGIGQQISSQNVLGLKDFDSGKSQFYFMSTLKCLNVCSLYIIL